jgi:hypothetical protein
MEGFFSCHTRGLVSFSEVSEGLNYTLLRLSRLEQSNNLNVWFSIFAGAMHSLSFNSKQKGQPYSNTFVGARSKDQRHFSKDERFQWQMIYSQEARKSVKLTKNWKVLFISEMQSPSQINASIINIGATGRVLYSCYIYTIERSFLLIWDKKNINYIFRFYRSFSMNGRLSMFYIHCLIRGLHQSRFTYSLITSNWMRIE